MCTPEQLVIQAGDVFRCVPVFRSMSSIDPRAAVEQAARDLLRALAELPIPPTVRVADAEGSVACLIQVWDARRAMPTGPERRRRSGGGREGCRGDILAVVRAAGHPLTRKEVVKALRQAGKD